MIKKFFGIGIVGKFNHLIKYYSNDLHSFDSEMIDSRIYHRNYGSEKYYYVISGCSDDPLHTHTLKKSKDFKTECEAEAALDVDIYAASKQLPAVKFLKTVVDHNTHKLTYWLNGEWHLLKRQSVESEVISANNSLEKAEKGDAHHQRLLGLYFQHGMGVEENNICAYKWYSIASHTDSSGDINNLLGEVKVNMTEDEIVEADALTKDWLQKNSR